MDSNLMDSIISIASIAKRYNLGIHIYGERLYLDDIDKEWNCKLIDLKDREFLFKDLDDVCRCFKEECDELTGTV